MTALEYWEQSRRSRRPLGRLSFIQSLFNLGKRSVSNRRKTGPSTARELALMVLAVEEGKNLGVEIGEMSPYAPSLVFSEEEEMRERMRIRNLIKDICKA